MSVNEIRLGELEYVIIPGRLYNQNNLEEMHSSAFGYWKTFWEDVFLQNGCPGDLDEDSFLRQNMICILKTKNEIAGMHLYSFYNLHSEACLNHSYIKNSYNELYIRNLRASGIKYVMSLEYLTVNPNWRKKQLGLSLGNLLVGLSGEVLKSVNYDSSVAPSRSDVGVTAMACDIGGEVIVSGVEMHKTVCDLIAIEKKKVKPHPSESVNFWVNKLWLNRKDYTEMTFSETIKIQKAG